MMYFNFHVTLDTIRVEIVFEEKLCIIGHMASREIFNLPDLTENPIPAMGVAIDLPESGSLNMLKGDYGSWLVDQYYKCTDRISNHGIEFGERVNFDNGSYVSSEDGYGNFRVRAGIQNGHVSIYFHVGSSRSLRDLGIVEFREQTEVGLLSIDRKISVGLDHGIVQSIDEATTILQKKRTRFQS